MSFRGIALLVILCSGILTVWTSALFVLSVSQIAVFALAAATIVQGMRGGLHFATHGRVPLALLAFAPLLGAIQLMIGTSAYNYATLTRTLEWAFMVCVFGLVCTFKETEQEKFRQGLLWFSFVVAAVALLQYFTAHGKVFWMIDLGFEGGVGPFPNRNHWGAFIELTIPVAIYQLLTSQGNTWLHVVMIGTMYASVIAGASRGGSLLCTVALALVPLLVWRRDRSIKGVAAVLIATLAVTSIFTWVVGPETLWKRFLMPDPYQVRREFLLSSISMFRVHPWFGFGIGTWATVYPQFALIDPGSHANEAHNEWAQWAAEGGAVLLSIMVAILGWTFSKVLRSPWAVGLVLVLVHCWVEYPFERQALAGWFAAMLGLLAAHSPAGETIKTENR